MPEYAGVNVALEPLQTVCADGWVESEGATPKATVGCAVIWVPLIVTVTVLVSATVDFSVAVVCPLAAVVAGVDTVFPVPLTDNVTVTPEIGLLKASSAVTVIVETCVPSESTPVVGLAVAVELAALTVVL